MRELQSIDDLQPNERNPRTITREALDGLKCSIEEFGDLSGIVWNCRTGSLVCGHQRLRALRERYGTELRLVDGEIIAGSEHFRVRVVDWDETRDMIANVTANNPHIAGTFQDDQLRWIMERIASECPDYIEPLILGDYYYNVPIEKNSNVADTEQAGHLFEVIVEMDDEMQQLAFIEKMKQEGIKCRALVS